MNQYGEDSSQAQTDRDDFRRADNGFRNRVDSGPAVSYNERVCTGKEINLEGRWRDVSNCRVR